MERFLRVKFVDCETKSRNILLCPAVSIEKRNDTAEICDMGPDLVFFSGFVKMATGGPQP
jgi:hypothetical protein